MVKHQISNKYLQAKHINKTENFEFGIFKLICKLSYVSATDFPDWQGNEIGR